MIEPIRVHPSDGTDKKVRDRHEQIIKRLEELGAEQVRLLVNTAGLPTHWSPIILAWLKEKSD